MNNKGGTIFTAVPDAETAIYSSFGFATIDLADAPEPVAEYWTSHRRPSEGLVHLKAR